MIWVGLLYLRFPRDRFWCGVFTFTQTVNLGSNNNADGLTEEGEIIMTAPTPTPEPANNASSVTTPPTESGNGNPSGDTPQGFTPPATQEDLNRIIAERVARERAKYADYDDLRAKAETLDDIENANKTEAQRQADALAQAQAQLQAYKDKEQRQVWASEIASGTNIPPSVLRGSTKDELQAHFDELKNIITTQQPQTPGGRGIAGVGQEPSAPQNVPLKDQIAAAQAENNPQLVKQLKALMLGQ